MSLFICFSLSQKILLRRIDRLSIPGADDRCCVLLHNDVEGCAGIIDHISICVEYYIDIVIFLPETRY